MTDRPADSAETLSEELRRKFDAVKAEATATMQRIGDSLARDGSPQTAGEMLRYGYCLLFSGVHQPEWAVWDGFSLALAQGWNDAEYAQAMIDRASALGPLAHETGKRICDEPGFTTERFAWVVSGMTMVGAVCLAATKRGKALLAAQRDVSGDTVKATASS